MPDRPALVQPIADAMMFKKYVVQDRNNANFGEFVSKANGNGEILRKSRATIQSI